MSKRPPGLPLWWPDPPAGTFTQALTSDAAHHAQSLIAELRKMAEPDPETNPQPPLIFIHDEVIIRLPTSRDPDDRS